MIISLCGEGGVDEIDAGAGAGDGGVEPAVKLQGSECILGDAAHVDIHIFPLSALGLVAAGRAFYPQPDGFGTRF